MADAACLASTRGRSGWLRSPTLTLEQMLPAPDKSPGTADVDQQPNAHDYVLTAIARFERPLIHFAARLLGGDIERARDVTQEALLRLCRELPLQAGSFEADESRLAAWLFKVCRNLALDVRRKEKRMQPMTEATAKSRPSEEFGPAHLAERRDASSLIAVAIADLPNSQQEVLQLRFEQGMSYRELSDVTGRSVSSVGVLIHKGIRALQGRLGKELGVPLAAVVGGQGRIERDTNTEMQR